MLRAIFTPYASTSSAVNVLLTFAWMIILCVLWQFLGPRLSMPTPMETLAAFDALLNQRSLLVELGVSLMLNLQALAISTGLSLLFCYLNPIPAFRPLQNLSTLLRFLGIAGLTFTFMMLVRDAYELKLAILVFGMSAWFITSMLAEIESIPNEEFEHARTMKMGHVRTTFEVIIRGRLDKALEIMRQNAGMGWMMVAMVEGLVRSGGGVGALLVEENKYLRLDQIFATLITILVLGWLQDQLLVFIRRRAFPYAVEKKG